MRSLLFAACAWLPVLAFAAGTPAGRWEGAVDIPGRRLIVVLDLEATDTNRWIGSLTVPTLGIKGVALSSLAVDAATGAFDAVAPLASGSEGALRFKGELRGERLGGQIRQGGHSAAFSLGRTGPPQVDARPRGTPVSADVARTWSGQFELGGYARTVTIALANRDGGEALAKFVIVGKRTTDVAVDLVVQEGDFIRVESQSMRIGFDGRLREDRSELRGAIAFGSLELPLVLRPVEAQR